MGDPYPEHRPNVGVVLFNTAGKVWLGKRFGADEPWCWQFPQGGVDRGEAPEKAAERELFEETGIGRDLITPMGAIDEWLTYDFPPEVLSQRKFNLWKGQKQRWFAYQYQGTDDDFDLTAVPPQEFSGFKWVDLADTPALIIPWKRGVYEAVARAFAAHARPSR